MLKEWHPVYNTNKRLWSCQSVAREGAALPQSHWQSLGGSEAEYHVKANIYVQWKNNVINKVFLVAQTSTWLLTTQINQIKRIFSNVKCAFDNHLYISGLRIMDLCILMKGVNEVLFANTHNYMEFQLKIRDYINTERKCTWMIPDIILHSDKVQSHSQKEVELVFFTTL